ncbi:MAG: HlyD family secretion protein [Pseudobdellovibrionaceae bacterium]
MNKLALIAASLMALTACQPDGNTIHGYVEGEFVRIAPTSEGLLESLSVERGQSVKAGDPLFALDTTELAATRDAAEAELKKAQADLNDLTKGERPEEIEIIMKQRDQVQATLTNARIEYNRVLPLSKSGAASVAARDDAKAALDNATARMAELDAQLKAANLGARIDQIEGARAMVQAAQFKLDQAEKRLTDAAPLAPAAGVIEDTYYRAGEYVGAGQPVVSLLPPENVKIRFYVSQALVPTLKTGEAVNVTCDGCKEAVAAHITYIAPESEYTPPVIYSVESREKLVFLIEAAPDAYHEELRPGLPVDVALKAE